MITHKNGTMTVTAANGQTAKRKTDNLYVAAIVGRRKVDGKLVIVYAGNTARAARNALATNAAGTHVNFKFREATDFEVVEANAADLAVIAAHVAERVAFWQAEREQRAIDDGAAQWEPVDDPDAWKAKDAALIAARRK